MKKIITVTLFVSLIATFVAYRGGLFDKKTVAPQENTESHAETEEPDTLVDLTTVEEVETAVVNDTETVENKVSTPVMEEGPTENMHIYSSKSAPPFTQHDFEKMMEQQDVDPRIYSSKSLIISTPTDFDSLLYNPWNLDSVKKNK